MTELERTKLRMLRDRFGILTAEKALEMALRAEQQKLRYKPSDNPYTFFALEQQGLENMAWLLEKEAAARTAR
jgi:hypothetical protein